MKKWLLVSILALTSVFSAEILSAQKLPTFDLFHGDGCPHCADERAWIEDTLVKIYPDLVVNEYEIWNDAGNQQLFRRRLEELNAESNGVPTNIIGDKVLVGFQPEKILAELAAQFGPGAVPASEKTDKSAEISAEISLEKSWWRSLLDFFGGANTVKIGQAVPAFTTKAVMKDDSVRDFSLDTMNGKWKVVFFYPKDKTFVCPTELRELVANKAKFNELNTEIIPVSTDSAESHISWREDLGGADFDFPWIADTDASVARLFGVFDENEHVALRGTFLIDPAGVLQSSIITNTSVGRNTDELIRLIEANQTTQETGELCGASWEKGDETLKPE